jgi:hypothetical protein
MRTTTSATTTRLPTVALRIHSMGCAMGENVWNAMGPPTAAVKNANTPPRRSR